MIMILPAIEGFNLDSFKMLSFCYSVQQYYCSPLIIRPNIKHDRLHLFKSECLPSIFYYRLALLEFCCLDSWPHTVCIYFSTVAHIFGEGNIS